MRNCSGNSCYGCSQPCCDCLISGNSVDVNLNQNDCEVRVDIDVARINTIRIWGQVLDSDGSPISNALVKLVKPINVNGTCEFQGVAHSVSDCNGFYQFDVPSNGDYSYKILVGKSICSNERIIGGHDCYSPRSQCQYNRPMNQGSCIPSYDKCYDNSKPCNDSCNCNYNYDRDCCNSNCDSCNNSCSTSCNPPCNPTCNPACNSNCDSCTNNYAYDSCKQSYDPYNQTCDATNQNYDPCTPPYKPQNNGNFDCCDTDNKYSTYYYSEPETIE